MAAPVCCRGLRPLVLSWSRELPCVWRALHTSAVCAKNRAARVRVGKGDKPVTYEQAHAPHHIAHRKGWLSLHTELFVEHPLFANTCEGHKDEKTRVTAFQGHLFQQGKQEANRQLQDEAGQAQPQNRQDGQTVTLAMMCVAQHSRDCSRLVSWTLSLASCSDRLNTEDELMWTQALWTQALIWEKR
ncbi:28S ribosomal protein S24, mitochondrial isoform X2 [Balaenoptera acutorostrata]|uniref:28S ribosomal protein S24, mitochondrial isoform X2 n=1 Tax=Balaenoptera acutorostrata TaxID=9767 RepID=A0ABM3TV46_BALAC|nr:28S ribosomal protein S24, mitochondrial isoform X2 [Balaenoptera acutorostrata]